MLKGGYQIIDFEGVKVVLNEETHIDGIYSLVSNNKVKLISGLRLIEEEGLFEIGFSDMFVQFSRNFGEYGEDLYRGHIHTGGKGTSESYEIEIEVNPNDTIIFRR